MKETKKTYINLMFLTKWNFTFAFVVVVVVVVVIRPTFILAESQQQQQQQKSKFRKKNEKNTGALWRHHNKILIVIIIVNFKKFYSKFLEQHSLNPPFKKRKKNIQLFYMLLEYSVSVCVCV